MVALLTKSFLPHSTHGTECDIIAADWLAQFSAALILGNCEGVASTFLSDGWLRDILVFSWNNRSLEGREKISAYLRDSKTTGIRDIEIDRRSGLEPQYGPIAPRGQGVCSGFTFTTDIMVGKGYFRLQKDKADGQWRALTVLMMMDHLKGHPEIGPEAGVYGGHTLSWSDIRLERQRRIEESPHVIIVGAGQTGLIIGARFHQMNIPTIIVETNARVGDNWRKRYPTLTLHTVRNQHLMLYQPYPQNWPMFTPRDKLADWLEQYAQSQDLTVWTKSRPLPTPTYDACAKRWTVVIDRDGHEVTLHPTHIVLATGALGAPRIPEVVDKDLFEGIVIHGSQYQGGRPFTGKNVVVVGAGNTSADVCQDLTFHSAASVTMIQRSSTCVISAAKIQNFLRHAYPDEVPVEVSDFKFSATPFSLLKQLLSEQSAGIWANEEDMLDKLKKAGLNINLGPGGGGTFPLTLDRLGGYWLDVGCAELIGSGKVQIKQGVEIERFTQDSVVFSDGSSLEADVVIFATGYQSIKDSMKETFGEETIDRTDPVWGLDEEGELRGCYRPSGHPGLWYAAGDFYNARFSSKQLGLEIQAIEMGLMHI